MKKYLNKGLMYAWFNSAKVPIAIGIFVWGFIVNIIIKNNLEEVKRDIVYNFSNYIHTTAVYEYMMLGVIFIAIYSIAKGINKRNMEMFLSSGPYTKKQIKYNELINLFIILVLFVITYVYIAFMAYVSNREFLSIVEGYQTIVLIEITKIFLLGIIGIIFMLIMDFMFSNTVIGFINMLSIIPISILIIIIKVCNIVNYSGLGDNFSMSNHNQVLILLDRITTKEISKKELAIEIIIVIIIIVIMIIIYSVVQKKYKLENCNKIFSSKINENSIVTLVAIGIGSFASLNFLGNFINGMQFKNGRDLPLIGIDLVKGLGAEITCIVVVGFIAYKIMKKILKNIV